MRSASFSTPTLKFGICTSEPVAEGCTSQARIREAKQRTNVSGAAGKGHKPARQQKAANASLLFTYYGAMDGSDAPVSNRAAADVPAPTPRPSFSSRSQNSCHRTRRGVAPRRRRTGTPPAATSARAPVSSCCRV